MIRTAVYPLC